MVCGSGCTSNNHNNNKSNHQSSSRQRTFENNPATYTTNRTNRINQTFNENLTQPQMPSYQEYQQTFNIPVRSAAANTTFSRTSERNSKSPVSTQNYPNQNRNLTSQRYYQNLHNTYPRQAPVKYIPDFMNYSSHQGRIMPPLRELREYRKAAPRFYSTPRDPNFLTVPGPNISSAFDFTTSYYDSSAPLEVEHTDRIFTDSELIDGRYNVLEGFKSTGGPASKIYPVCRSQQMEKEDPSQKILNQTFSRPGADEAHGSNIQQSNTLNQTFSQPSNSDNQKSNLGKTFQVKAASASPMSWGSFDPFSTFSVNRNEDMSSVQTRDDVPQRLIATPVSPSVDQTQSDKSKVKCAKTNISKRKRSRERREQKTPVKIYVNVTCSCENLKKCISHVRVKDIPEDLIKGLNEGTYSIIKNLTRSHSASSPSDMEEVSSTPSRPFSTPINKKDRRYSTSFKMGIGPTGIYDLPVKN